MEVRLQRLCVAGVISHIWSLTTRVPPAQVSDIALEDYIAAKPKYAVYVPHSAGRYQSKRFRKAQCPIVERLACSMMRTGRNNGKKLMANRIVEHALDIIHLLTDQNPIQASQDPLLAEKIVLSKFPAFPASQRPTLPPLPCSCSTMPTATRSPRRAGGCGRRDQLGPP